MSDSNRHLSIPANCKVCGTRVTPDIRFAGKDIECPDCFSSISIPTLEQHAQNVGLQKKEEVRQPEDVGTYGLQAPNLPAADPAPEPPKKKPQPSTADDGDDLFQNKPSGAELAAQTTSEPRKKKKKRKKPAEENPDVDDARESGVTALEALAEIRRHEIPDPPKSLFFTNVFEFPWTSTSALARWVFLSFSMAVTLLMGAFLIYLWKELGSGAMIPIAFMAMAQAALFAWSSAYAAACAVSIMQDTSAGIDEVLGWPEGGVIDWIGSLFTLMIPFFFAGFVAYLVTLPISFATGSLIPYIFIVHALLIPIVMLSGLDAESIWFPVSKMVNQSFRTVAKSWIQVTVLLNSLLIAVGFIAFLIVDFEPFTAAFVLAPVFASTVFIYSRLLGRMAYTIGQNAPDDDEDAKSNEDSTTEDSKE